MKVFELLSFNKELLSKIQLAGLKPDDWRYAEMYQEYSELKRQGEKITYIVNHLAMEYQICERQVYSIIRKLEQDVITA